MSKVKLVIGTKEIEFDYAVLSCLTFALREDVESWLGEISTALKDGNTERVSSITKIAAIENALLNAIMTVMPSEMTSDDAAEMLDWLVALGD